MSAARIFSVAGHRLARTPTTGLSSVRSQLHPVASLYKNIHGKHLQTRSFNFTSHRTCPTPGTSHLKTGPWTVYGRLLQRHRTFRTSAIIVLVVTVSYYSCFLEQVPDEDARRRLLFSSQASVGRQCVTKYKTIRENLKDHMIGLEDDRVRRYHRVLGGIIDTNGLGGNNEMGEGKWEVMVLETEKDSGEASPSNFFSAIFPGRKAIVSTATLSLFPSDEELAHLLCHEIAHVLLNHRREMHSEGELWTPILFTLIFLDIRMLVGQIVILYGLKRWWYKGVGEMREIEADRLGLRLAVKAGYEPENAVRAWKRLAGMESSFSRKCKVSLKNMPTRLEKMEELQEHLERRF